MSDPLFAGLKVIDCATVIAAPAAATMLADYGADVVKIEAPGEGDMLRLLSHIPTTPSSGNDWFWHLDGRNKRGITLDLKEAGGREVLTRLVSECDVFITNQPHSVRATLGLTYEQLQGVNPKMIYASLTAYGEDGPERERKGFDQLAYWARSGLMDLMRAPDTTPAQGLPGMGDHPTGVALYAGIVTALLQRERTGEGAHVQTSLLANGLWSAAGIAQGALAGGDMPAYRAVNTIYPAMMQVYRTRDQRFLQLNMIRNDDLQTRLLTAMDIPHLLVDARFGTPELMWENRAAFGAKLQQVFAQRDAADWLSLFMEFDLPVNLVARVEETVNDAQILANNMAVAAPESMQQPLLIRHPIQISSVASVPLQPGPGLGEHTKEVLHELGYAPEQIAELERQGVI